MLNIINSELYKARKSKAIKTIFIINLIAGLIIGFGATFLGEKIGFDINGYEYIANLGKVNFGFLMIFAYIIPAMIITGEFKDNTMKNALFVGTSRNRLLLSKMIVMGIISLSLVLLLIIPPFIMITILKGWGAAFTMVNIFGVIGSLIRLWIYLFAYCCIFSLIGVVSRDVIGSIALAYGFYMMEKVLLMASQVLSKFAWVKNILLTSKDDFISIGAAQGDNFIQYTLFIVGVIAVTILLATIHFRKQDIKS